MSEESDTTPLIDKEKDAEKKLPWDIFEERVKKTEEGSEANTSLMDNTLKVMRCVTVIVVFCVVLGGAVISKGTLLFMISQINKNTTRAFCNENIDKKQQFVVSLPEDERVQWLWLLIFAYFVPELGMFLRSTWIYFFKGTSKIEWGYTFYLLLFTELCSAVGNALLIFIVLPELDVIKGAMITNACCFIPGLLGFITRQSEGKYRNLKSTMDILCLVAQASAFVVWPLLENKPILYVIPPAVLLISTGWAENFISKETSINTLKKFAKKKMKFKSENYVMYMIICPLKCLLFFLIAMIIFVIREGHIYFMFSEFGDAFRSRTINVVEIVPVVGGMSTININDAVSSGHGTTITTNVFTPIWVWLINIATSYFCYAFAKYACKILMQGFCFACALCLSVPVLIMGLIIMINNYNENNCAYSDTIPNYLFFNMPTLYVDDFIGMNYGWVWLIWLISQIWVTIHIWDTKAAPKIGSTEVILFKPMYDSFLIDQSLTMNRRRNYDLDQEKDQHQEEEKKRKITKIYACGTMWHEAKDEMLAFLKSIMRLDRVQCAMEIGRKYLSNKGIKGVPCNYFTLESHIYFDDAFKECGSCINKYVEDLINSVNDAASMVHGLKLKIEVPKHVSTPYGGRLTWTLPGDTKLIAHLKDKKKIKAKKRWSQVMYMYYLLGHRLAEKMGIKRGENAAKNTYILALDGDIDFQPKAVFLLVDLMKKNETVGAACGRIHPMGEGGIAWYQMFEYAVGHWFQKATEHVFGCVLCSPGCFSLFRGSALMDDSVMRKYAKVASEAMHSIQYDQGEDRWLCTLLLQQGHRVEYSAASDSFTHCPEGFNEFWNQRRRWIPSTNANIIDLLRDEKHVIKINNSISRLYIIYQGILLIGTVLGPGTIFLMLIGAFVAAFKTSQMTSLILNIIPVLTFIIVCATCKPKTQLFFGGIISSIYGLIMMAVLVGILLQIKDDGILAPSSMFFFVVAAEFIIAALIHPNEFNCLKYGVIYYVTVPSMYMLLIIYSVFNTDNRDWGTRENKPEGMENKQNVDGKDPHGSFTSFFNSFKTFITDNREPGTQKTKSEDNKEDEKETQHKCVKTKESGLWKPGENLDEKENEFWKKMIEKYLAPEEKEPEFKRKLNELKKNLKDLKDKVVFTFLMLNSLFIVAVFLLTLEKDTINVKWPFDPKVNFSYATDSEEIRVHLQRLQLEPIGFVFLIFFALVLIIQFVGMLVHRFGTFTHLIADNEISRFTLGLNEHDVVEKVDKFIDYEFANRDKGKKYTQCKDVFKEVIRKLKHSNGTKDLEKKFMILKKHWDKEKEFHGGIPDLENKNENDSYTNMDTNADANDSNKNADANDTNKNADANIKNDREKEYTNMDTNADANDSNKNADADVKNDKEKEFHGDIPDLENKNENDSNTNMDTNADANDSNKNADADVKNEMKRKRGREAQIEEDKFIAAIQDFHDELIQENQIVPRNHPVWDKLAAYVDFKLKPMSFFIKVSSNHCNVKDMLLPQEKDLQENTINDFESEPSSSSGEVNFDLQNDSFDIQPIEFEFMISKEKMEDITEYRYLHHSNNGRRPQARLWRVFKPGLYQEYFREQIWAVTHLRCGFLFKNAYIRTDLKGGRFTGKCKCGATLTGHISNFFKTDTYIISCTYVPGTGKCGKPYLRKPIRQNVVNELRSKPVECYRAEQARKFMTHGNDPEPPMVRKPEVLYQAKYEAIAENYANEDPIKALGILKYKKCFGSIGEIGFDPFYVHYFQNSCIQSYKRMCARALKKGDKISVAIDSTGGIVHKISKRHIFLHVVAVAIPEGQLSIAHMLSETSHTESICHWLRMWRRAGAPLPSICVMDWSRALLHGVASAFASCASIEGYADKLPEIGVFIRLDVAHTVHKYARYCKGYRREVKTFFMACVGLLIRCCSRYQAHLIIKNVLIVCLSRTNGNLKETGEKSPADIAEYELLQLITKDESPLYEEPDEEFEEGTQFKETDNCWGSNSWQSWGQEIKSEVEAYIEGKEGDRINAYYDCRDFAQYILNDVSLLPLWSNIYAKDYGVPEQNPSSAAVEQVFRKIKNTAFSKKLPMRVDVFVQEHLEYLDGKVKLLNDAMLVNDEDQQSSNKIENKTHLLSQNQVKKIDQIDVITINDSIENLSGFNDESQNPYCIACREPAGSHSCVICEALVHAIPPCSSAYGEEGYRQKRVCATCQQNPDIIALKEYDNWKNFGVQNQKIMSSKGKVSQATQGKENKRRTTKLSLYLGEQRTKIHDRIRNKKSNPIPILKNGSTLGLSPIILEKKDIYFKMTCGFDSVVQIILAHAYDDQLFFDMVSRYAKSNAFFALVCQLKKHGVTSKSYTLRGKCLKTYYENEMKAHPDLPNTWTIVCNDNVGNLVEHLFAGQFPSYQQVRSCTEGCAEQIRSFACYEVLKTQMVQMKMEDIVADWRTMSRFGKCSQGNCSGVREDKDILETPDPDDNDLTRNENNTNAKTIFFDQLSNTGSESSI